jgi:hypothetical protein
VLCASGQTREGKEEQEGSAHDGSLVSLVKRIAGGEGSLSSGADDGAEDGGSEGVEEHNWVDG